MEMKLQTVEREEAGEGDGAEYGDGVLEPISGIACKLQPHLAPENGGQVVRPRCSSICIRVWQLHMLLLLHSKHALQSSSK